MRPHRRRYIRAKVSGDYGDRVTPVPIPNTEVKPVCADGTWGATPWESRSSPEFFVGEAPRPRRGASSRACCAVFGGGELAGGSETRPDIDLVFQFGLVLDEGAAGEFAAFRLPSGS